MPVLAIANQKGGVAKTATAFNLAHALVKNEKKVLMVDLDPQGSLTDYAGYEPASLDLTIYPVLHKKISAREAIIPHPEGPDLLPANIDLAAIELELAGALEREFKLADALEDIRPLYDYIVLDCPPFRTAHDQWADRGRPGSNSCSHKLQQSARPQASL